MKKDQKWQKPDLSAMKKRSAKKVLGTSRSGSMPYSTGVGPTPPMPVTRYSTGIGPTPPMPTPI